MLLKSRCKNLTQRVIIDCSTYSSTFYLGLYTLTANKSKKNKRHFSHLAVTQLELPLPNTKLQRSKTIEAFPNNFLHADNDETSTDPGNEPITTNEEILNSIRKESLRRTQLRQHLPSQEWEKRFANKTKESLMTQCIKNGRVTVSMLQTPISIGDLVLVLERSFKVHIVIELPQEIKSNTYTFLNEDGDIIYGPKSCISLRIPNAIPSSLIKSLRLTKLEKKYPGIAPSGMPDSIFSRTSSKSPTEASEKYSHHDKLESTSQRTIPTEVDLHNVGDALLVAQAASQFLTDTDVNTYIVPVSARKVYAHSLRDLSVRVFQLIPKYMERLDLLYKTLEKDRLDSLIIFRRSYSIFELFGVVQKDKELPNIRNACLPPTNILSAEYIAIIISLKRSCRAWNIHIQKSTMTPLRVSFRSRLKFLVSESTKSLLSNEGMKEFESFYINFSRNGGVTDIPKSILQVIKMLKSFVADGCAHDQMTASLVSTLIKKLDIRSKKEGLLSDTISRVIDDPRSRAHEILTSLAGNYNQSPVTWLETSRVPHTETSVEADYYSNYHEYVNDSNGEVAGPKSNVHRKDPLAKVREDFGKVPIYCIDSTEAYEIDDGISISSNESHFIITVHVANPTSFFGPESQLSKISYLMGSTIYSPEGPLMMLPKSVSQKCGLGLSGSTRENLTRTFAIEFRLEKRTVLKYINDIRLGHKDLPPDDVAKVVHGNIISTVTIKAYHASNFPKNFTYARVNDILNDENNIKRFNSDRLSPNSHELNLFYLYHISSILNHIRVGLGSGLDTYASQSNVKVDFTDEEQPCRLLDVTGGWSIPLDRSRGGITPIISITTDAEQSPSSKSQQLVSSFMIIANYAGATFAKNNKIPIIYRKQSLMLSRNVKNTIESLNQHTYDTGELPSLDLQLDMRSVLTSAHLSTEPGSHDSLGLKVYLNLTSPLRRHVDLVNHYNLQLFLTGTKLETNKELAITASHLQACEYNNRVSQRFADKFWTCKFLEKYFILLSLGKIEVPIFFSFVLRSDAKYGDVKASIIEFPNVNVTISQNDYLRDKFAKREFQVGRVAKTKHFFVKSLDVINGEIVVEFFNECV